MMTKKETRFSIHIEAADERKLNPRSWPPSKLFEYVVAFQKALVSIDPDIADAEEDEAFFSLDKVDDGSIKPILRLADWAKHTELVLVAAMEEGGGELPPGAHKAMSDVIDLAKRDNVDLSVGSSDDESRRLLITSKTKLVELPKPSLTRTSEAGTIHLLNADKMTASMRSHERVIKLSGITDEFVSLIAKGWAEHPQGTKGALFRVDGVGEWDRIERRVLSMQVEQLRIVKPSTLSTLRKILELLGPLSEETIETYGRPIPRITGENLDKPERS